ncbi:phasin family protein [Neptunomonas sp.]|uniref:phasin family protein n=1 Tax=Neptunomonas sp. TaxID=1971898 RepID=UPI00356B6089
MSQDTVKDIQETLEPVTMITDINKSTAEKLIALQTEYMTALFNAGLAQMKALSGVAEPKEAFELQIQFFKDLDAKLANITEKEVAMLSETKEQLMDVIGKNISVMSDMYGIAEVTKPMPNARKKTKEAINLSAHKQNGLSNKAASTRKSA